MGERMDVAKQLEALNASLRLQHRSVLQYYHHFDVAPRHRVERAPDELIQQALP